jgi:hemerythrin-like domain-containing protein
LTLIKSPGAHLPQDEGRIFLDPGGIAMQSVIQRLHDDHASMITLLDILDRELDNIERAEIANFEIMCDVMRYLTRYSDAVHHPMEDLVYACLSDRSAKARTQLAPMPVEHNRIEQKSRALQDAVIQITDGGMALRADLVRLGRTYVTDLRHHIELEEEHLFPMAESMLDDTDLEEVAKILAERRDPIFGDVLDADFRDLYEHIQSDA